MSLSPPRYTTMWQEMKKITEQEGHFHSEQSGRIGTKIQATVK